MTTTPDPAKLAGELRTEGQVLYERYRDLCPNAVFKIIDNTLLMFYRAYEDLPRPEREPEQMDIMDLLEANDGRGEKYGRFNQQTCGMQNHR